MSEEIAGISSKKSDDIFAKIAINREADRALSEIIFRVNHDFEAGKATKQDVASYIILKFAKDFSDDDVHELRSQFFNPILLMEATLKRAKETGVVPDSIRNLLYEQFAAGQINQPGAKKPKKPLNHHLIKDKVSFNKEVG